MEVNFPIINLDSSWTLFRKGTTCIILESEKYPYVVKLIPTENNRIGIKKNDIMVYSPCWNDFFMSTFINFQKSPHFPILYQSGLVDYPIESETPSPEIPQEGEIICPDSEKYCLALMIERVTYSFREWIEESEKINFSTVKHLLFQIYFTILLLQKDKLVHYDLHSRNIMLKKLDITDPLTRNPWVYKIGDKTWVLPACPIMFKLMDNGLMAKYSEPMSYNRNFEKEGAEKVGIYPFYQPGYDWGFVLNIFLGNLKEMYTKMNSKDGKACCDFIFNLCLDFAQVKDLDEFKTFYSKGRPTKELSEKTIETSLHHFDEFLSNQDGILLGSL